MLKNARLFSTCESLCQHLKILSASFIYMFANTNCLRNNKKCVLLTLCITMAVLQAECGVSQKKRAKGAPEAIIIKKMIHRSSLSGVLSNRVNRYGVGEQRVSQRPGWGNLMLGPFEIFGFLDGTSSLSGVLSKRVNRFDVGKQRVSQCSGW